jgi:hypothetical protein
MLVGDVVSVRDGHDGINCEQMITMMSECGAEY